MLPYKPSIVGYPHDYGNIQIDKHMLKCFYCKFTQIYQLTMESGAFLGASLNMLAIYPTLQGSPQASSSDRIRTALLRLSTLIRNVPWYAIMCEQEFHPFLHSGPLWSGFWLTNYLETLLVQVWYPMTVATQSRAQKKATGFPDWRPNLTEFHWGISWMG